MHLIPAAPVAQAIPIDPWYKQCDDTGETGIESDYRQETAFIPS
jgi:hypothetical protein